MQLDSKKMGKERRKLKKILLKEETGEYLPGTALNSLTAWKANAARGDSYFQRKTMTNYYYTVKAGIENDYKRRSYEQSCA
jgi:hypothetical protein